MTQPDRPVRARRRLYEAPEPDAPAILPPPEGGPSAEGLAPAGIPADALPEAPAALPGRSRAPLAPPAADGAPPSPEAEERYREALALIEDYRWKAMRLGLLPLPGLDWVAVTRLQVRLLRALADRYGMDLEADTARSALAHCWEGHTGVTAVAGAVGSTAKWIPFLGTALGGSAVALAAGASTYAAGRAFLDGFARGRTAEDLDPAALADVFRVHYDAAR